MVLPIILGENVEKLGKIWEFRVDLMRQREYIEFTS